LQSFTDDGCSPGFNYYTMWGFSTHDQLWIRCTDLIALLPLPWGYGNRYYNLLPLAYRDLDSILVNPYNPWITPNLPTPPLQSFLNLLGFEMDFIRTELESLLSVNDAKHVSGALLPLLAYQFGLPNDPEIGMAQERILISNAMHLYKLKGSSRGITDFSSIMTGYPAAITAHKGYNLMLTLDDSVGAQGTGTWQAWPPPGTSFPAPAGANVGLHFAQIPNLLANGPNPATIIGFVPNPPPYNNTGIGVYTANPASGHPASNIDICTGAIPVLDFLSQTDGPGNITFQIQVLSTAAYTMDISLWGDAGNGTPIQIAATTTTAMTANNWKQYTCTANINPYYQNVTPPANAQIPAYYWIYPRVRIYGPAFGVSCYLTFGMIWAAKPSQIGQEIPTTYDYPRDVKIALAPQATNLMANPLTTFPNGFDGWTSANDPTHPTQNYSTSMYIHYETPDDPSALFAVNGWASLQVSPTQGANAVIWGGTVTSFSPPVSIPSGWFIDYTNSTPAQPPDWFNGAVPQLGPPRPWMDPPDTSRPANSWFFINLLYFNLLSGVVGGGDWFAQPQPPQAGNVFYFTAFPGQMLNFSVYGRYMIVQDPSNAQIQIGLRWYFPDGTFYEDWDTDYLTNDWQRFSFPPAGQSIRSITPVEQSTGLPAVFFYPFIRFPTAQSANFVFNSAMLAPGSFTTGPPPFLDAHLPAYYGNFDYQVGNDGSSYYFRGMTNRSFRLRTELYRWLPMASTYTLTFESGNVIPPIDQTLWP
jgi:phage tail-like protein